MNDCKMDFKQESKSNLVNSNNDINFELKPSSKIKVPTSNPVFYKIGDYIYFHCLMALMSLY